MADTDKDKERLKQLEQAFLKLVELTGSHEERIDTLTAAQANSEAKIAALADAQIRAESFLTTLSEAMTTLAGRMAELAAAQAHTDRRLDALIDIVREGRNGTSE